MSSNISGCDSLDSLVVGKPTSLDTDNFLQDAKEICETGLLSNNGPFVQMLESRISKYLQVRNAVAVSNATAGLEIGLRAMGFPPQGEVIVPSFTFAASVHAIVSAGLKPVFCDVDGETHLVTVPNVRPLITSQTAAILAVNLWGLHCDRSLCKYAASVRIPIIFDSAHAFGTLDDQGEPIGRSGSMHVFSMHATKLFNSFEGGLITTDDDELANKLRSLRNFGFTAQDTIDYIGTNAKLSEIHAAFACRQLNFIDETLLIYRRRAEQYSAELKRFSLPGVKLWNENYFDTGCTHSYICLSIKKEASVSRDDLMGYLRTVNIFAKRYFFPGMHNSSCYQTSKEHMLPNTERLNHELLILPTGRSVTSSDVTRIVASIAEVISSPVERLSNLSNKLEIDLTANQRREKWLMDKVAVLRERISDYETELNQLAS